MRKGERGAGVADCHEMLRGYVRATGEAGNDSPWPRREEGCDGAADIARRLWGAQGNGSGKECSRSGSRADVGG